MTIPSPGTFLGSCPLGQQHAVPEIQRYTLRVESFTPWIQDIIKDHCCRSSNIDIVIKIHLLLHYSSLRDRVGWEGGVKICHIMWNAEYVIMYTNFNIIHQKAPNPHAPTIKPKHCVKDCTLFDEGHLFEIQMIQICARYDLRLDSRNRCPVVGKD